MPQPSRFVLCICTFRRPEYLACCLTSVAAMKVPADISLTVLVVDNAPDPRHREIVVAHDFEYREEPRAGLVHARNQALESALAFEPDLIGFIDDDETLAPQWLVEMLAGLQQTRADALAGAIEIVLPPGADPLLKLAYQFRIPADYHPSATLPMGNVVFRRALLEDGLRFDPRYNQSGGEDVDFFRRAAQAGARLYRSPNARVYETLTPAKQSLRAWWQRQLRVTQTHCQQQRRPALLLIPQAIAEGIAALLLAVPALFSGPLKLRALKLSAKALGRLRALGAPPVAAYGQSDVGS